MNVKIIISIQVQGTLFVGKKRIQLMQMVYIGFMKEMNLLLMSMIFISEKKLYKIVPIVWQTMFQFIQVTLSVQTGRDLVLIKL